MFYSFLPDRAASSTRGSIVWWGYNFSERERLRSL